MSVYYSAVNMEANLYELRVLDCTHTAVYAWGVYDTSVSHFGVSVEVSSLTSRAWAYEVLLGGFITFAVQVREIAQIRAHLMC